MDDGKDCSAISLGGEEPLAGTAPVARRWLVLEWTESWGRNGYLDSGLPHNLVEALGALQKDDPELRVQLVRRPSQDAAALRMFFADCSAAPPSLYAADLPDLALAEPLQLPNTSDTKRWRRVDRTLYLVCTHGRRDRCCARLGYPLFEALAKEPSADVWMTTHLGGHRFAPTMLILPDGLCYGRVALAEAPLLVRAQNEGQVFDLERLRGNVAYAEPAQAAEIALRRRLGEPAIGALRLLEETKHGPNAEVLFLHVSSGRKYEVHVEQTLRLRSLLSCDASEESAAKSHHPRLVAEISL